MADFYRLGVALNAFAEQIEEDENIATEQILEIQSWITWNRDPLGLDDEKSESPRDISAEALDILHEQVAKFERQLAGGEIGNDNLGELLGNLRSELDVHPRIQPQQSNEELTTPAVRRRTVTFADEEDTADEEASANLGDDLSSRY